MENRDETFWQHYERGGFMDVQRYLKMVGDFVATGEIPSKSDKVKSPDAPWDSFDDPLLGYLIRLMSDPVVQVKVLSSKAAGKVFFVTVGRFIVSCLHNTQFESKRTWTEYKQSREVPDLSVGERRHWESLVDSIGEKHKEDGFDEKFFTQLFSTPGGFPRRAVLTSRRTGKSCVTTGRRPSSTSCAERSLNGSTDRDSKCRCNWRLPTSRWHALHRKSVRTMTMQPQPTT